MIKNIDQDYSTRGALQEIQDMIVMQMYIGCSSDLSTRKGMFDKKGDVRHESGMFDMSPA